MKFQGGGTIIGKTVQYVDEGGNGSLVKAVPNNGFRFVGWSDGVDTAERIDTDVKTDLNVLAEFEEIYVDFYSDGYLVRKYALNDFKNLNLNSLVGYKSRHEFVRWSFEDTFGTTSAEYIGDALKAIQNQYYINGIINVNDIKLFAEYKETEIGLVDKDFKTIAHGLGGLDGKNYLNSKEAFEYWYDKGQRFFEADICFTSDKRPIVSHFNFNVTYDEFMSSKKEGYTPLDLQDILQLINQYDDVVVDLDVLGVYYGPYETYDKNYEAFFKEFDETLLTIDGSKNLYNRLILEILPNNKTTMFLLAKQYCSFENFLYAEYYDSSSPITDENIESVCSWCKDNGINYLSIGGNIKSEWIKVMHEYGIYVFVFTFNNHQEMYKFYDMGADCIFTDYTFI